MARHLEDTVARARQMAAFLALLMPIFAFLGAAAHPGHDHEHVESWHVHDHGHSHSHDGHSHSHAHDGSLHHSHSHDDFHSTSGFAHAASSRLFGPLISLLLAGAAVHVPMLSQWSLMKGAAAHAGHSHDHDHALSDHALHHHSILSELSLVRKTAYGSALCDFRQCTLEPHRNLTLVAAVGDDDANAQTEENLNVWKLESDLSLIEHSLKMKGMEPKERKTLVADRKRLKGLVEAARTSEQAAPEGATAALGQLQWTLERADDASEELQVGSGRSISLLLNTTGTYILSLAMADDPSLHLHYALDVRYTRRDIESLLPSDRAAFFKAVQVLYETDAEKGRSLYGPDFRSMYEIWAAHALLGGDGKSHELLRGSVDAATADELLESAKSHRVPSEDKLLQGHRFQVRADSNDWEEVGARFKAAAKEHEQQQRLAGGDAAPPERLTDGAASSSKSPLDDAHLGLHQLPTASSSSAGVVASTGHGLVHESLSTNYVAFASLFEKAVQSVDPKVAVPYHAAGAPGDPSAERRRGAVTRHVRHATWSESFVTDSAALLLEQGDAAATEEKVAVGADGSTTQPATGTPITVEGRWAYFPVFTSIEPQKGEKGRKGHHDYKGYSVPLVVADVSPGAPNPFEKSYTLPPIATDHHHEFKDGQLFHTHGKGGAHRHV